VELGSDPGLSFNGPVPSLTFGDPAEWPPHDVVGLSTELTMPMVIEGYLAGVFPMPVEIDGRHEIAWFSPVDRGILPLDGLRVTRSLRKTMKRYTVSVDRAFDEVMARCADPSRPGAWIDDEITAVYGALHRRGLAHSVECWDAAGRLVGGLYGVSLGGLFAGESMFHDAEHGRDASKAALVHLVSRLTAAGGERLLDVQWLTPHLETLGVVEVPREEYLELLERVLPTPAPVWL